MSASCNAVSKRQSIGMARFVSDAPQGGFILFTPEMAKEAKESSKGSRPLRPDNVLKIAESLYEGQPVHPATLVFDRFGRLTDGHNRIEAQILRDISIVWNVVWGNSKEMEPLQDLGVARSLAQHLHAYESDRGVCALVCKAPSRAQRLSAVISAWYHLLVSRKNPSIHNAIRIWSALQSSFEYAFQHCAGDSRLRRAATIVAVMAAHLYGLREGEDFVLTLTKFLRDVRTGEALRAGDPAFTLRNYLIGLGTRNGATRRGDSQWVIMVKSLRVIQAEFQGERLSNIQPVRRPRELIESFIGDTDKMIEKIKLELFTVDGTKHELIPETKAARRGTQYQRYLAQKALEAAGAAPGVTSIRRQRPSR